MLQFNLLKMRKSALSVLSTFVFADQTVNIEIHNTSASFYTDFKETKGHTPTCGWIQGTDWTIINHPDGAPSWVYSAPYGFTILQSPIE